MSLQSAPTLGKERENMTNIPELNYDTKSIVTTLIGTGGRNDLAAIIENGTALELSVNYTLEHGDLNTTSGDSTIAAVATPPSGTKSITPNVYGVGVDAAGEGSGLYLSINSGNNSWGIYLRTPPNSSNYFQYSYSSEFPRSYDDVSSGPESEQGQTFTDENQSAPGTQVSISILADSPSTALIQFIPVLAD